MKVDESGEFEKGLQAKWEEDLTVKYDVLLEGVRNQIQSINQRQTTNAVDALDDLGGKNGLDALTRSAEVIEGEVKVQQLAYSLLKEKVANAYDEFLASRQQNLDRRESMLDGMCEVHSSARPTTPALPLLLHSPRPAHPPLAHHAPSFYPPSHLSRPLYHTRRALLGPRGLHQAPH